MTDWLVLLSAQLAKTQQQKTPRKRGTLLRTLTRTKKRFTTSAPTTIAAKTTAKTSDAEPNDADSSEDSDLDLTPAERAELTDLYRFKVTADMRFDVCSSAQDVLETRAAALKRAKSLQKADREALADLAVELLYDGESWREKH